MEQFNVHTTQNVVIQYTPANIGERLLARLLDLVIFGVYLFFAFLILIKSIEGIGDLEDFPVIATLICLPVIFYTIWIESLLNGRSFGKIIMGLKVVKISGKPASVGDFAIRWLLRMVEGEIALFTGLQIPVALVSGKGQRLGDMLAGTALIRTRHQTQIHNTILNYVNPQYRVVFPQVEKLNDNDVAIIKDVMQQALQNEQYGTIELLATKVKDTIGVYPPIDQLPSMQFLNIVLADYTHYHFEQNR